MAIASAGLAYGIFRDVFGAGDSGLPGHWGAGEQRLVWETECRGRCELSDVRCIDALIGRRTINTVSLEALETYREHGEPMARLEKNIDAARQVFEQLGEFGVDINHVTHEIERKGVKQHQDAYERLIATVADKLVAANV